MDLAAELWSKLKRPKIIARKQFSLEIKVWAYLGARIGIWKLSFWSKLKRSKIIAREPFSFEIKVWAYLGARIGIWKLSSGVN